MEVKYVLMNPTGNRTVLVETPIKKSQYPQIAECLMKAEPTAEQVGFVDFTDASCVKLHMAGGEFCGNATLSAAALSVKRGICESPVRIRVSGAKSGLSVELKNTNADTVKGLVKMPAPLEIRQVGVNLAGKEYFLPAVIFEGITHLILSGIGIAKKQAEKYAKQWSEELNAPCLGLMFYDSAKNKLKPLVYVRKPETLFWEHSCGSGSVAVAAYLNHAGIKKDAYDFAEPGGRIRVLKKGKSFYLEGSTKVEKEGICEIEAGKAGGKKTSKTAGSSSYDKRMEIIRAFEKEYGTDYTCYLHHENAWQLLFATIMSAQCTDERVNMVTKDLYVKYPDLQSFADADLKELEKDIHSTGFYHNKAKNIIACAKKLIEDYNGEVPSDLESLTALPGVGRKTANVIRGNIYHIDSIVVDTHVKRISRKLGFTEEEDPVRIEFDLMEKVPKEYWILINIHFIRLGRTVCKAPTPRCGECFLKDLCPSYKG